MMIHWKSLALILTGVLVGCAGNAARTAYADSTSGAALTWKCLGPSGTRGGVEDDLNQLTSEGYKPTLIDTLIVCGQR